MHRLLVPIGFAIAIAVFATTTRLSDVSQEDLASLHGGAPCCPDTDCIVPTGAATCPKLPDGCAAVCANIGGLCPGGHCDDTTPNKVCSPPIPWTAGICCVVKPAYTCKKTLCTCRRVLGGGGVCSGGAGGTPTPGGCGTTTNCAW